MKYLFYYVRTYMYDDKVFGELIRMKKLHVFGLISSLVLGLGSFALLNNKGNDFIPVSASKAQRASG